MTDKAHIWEYFENVNSDENKEHEKNINECNTYNQRKRIKISERIHTSQDLAWLKSLLHPSTEKSFVKFEVSAVISATKTKLILKMIPIPNLFPEVDYLTGFFDVWWWKSSLTKVEFNTIQKLSDAFPFLKRMMNNENIISGQDKFDLLLNNPKMISDAADYRKGLLTSKRFLIIEKCK